MITLRCCGEVGEFSSLRTRWHVVSILETFRILKSLRSYVSGPPTCLDLLPQEGAIINI